MLNEINHVYTQSEHKLLAKKMMNELIQEHPEYSNTIFCLSSYPIQKWAFDCRDDLGSDTKNILKAMYEMGSYYGFYNVDHIQQQLKSQSISNEIIEYLEPFIDTRIISSIHGDGEDISKYIMQHYYKDYLESFCKSHFERINKIFEPIEPILKELSNNSNTIHSNSSALLTLKHKIRSNQFNNRIIGNYEEVISIIDECISFLKYYPFNGYDMYQIAYRFSNDEKEYIIANKLSRSRTYVRARYIDAIEAISTIIWGYTNVGSKFDPEKI